MKIGERIKEIRISKGLTQADLSEKSGIALRTVQRIERDEVKPSIYSINAIGAVLGIQLSSEIFVEENKKFEFKIVITNLANLLEDSQTLIRRNWKSILVITLIISSLVLFKEIKSLIVGSLDKSTITVSTINCGKENECDIALTKMDENGKTIWSKTIGGTSYDKAGQVIKTKDGHYLVIGSTSSMGKGNYDVWLIKVSALGEIIWQKTYGDFLNDYGLKISAKDDNFYLIEGTKQICKTVNVSNDCIDQEWLFMVDEGGNVK